MRSSKVVVIGAGPAGSTAARWLALDGIRVTLLEARRLPRDKTCAGGVTPKARQWVPQGVLDDARCTVHRFEICGGRLPPFRLDEPTAEISMVQRGPFDYALAEAAASAGCDVLDGEPAEHVTELEDRVEVWTRRSTLVADFVIGADGYPSRVGHELGLGGTPSRRSLTISGHVPLSTTLPSDLAVISFSVGRGYAWYFPKGDHASVGVGARFGTDPTRPSVDALRDSLDAFAGEAGLGLEHVRPIGHWVPHGICPGPIVSRRCVLVGDAAGMTDPLFGEGIAYAIGSGRLAAQALLDLVAGRMADLTSYERRLRATYGRAMRRLDITARVVERSPTLALAAARISPWIRAYGVNVVAGIRAPFAFVPPELDRTDFDETPAVGGTWSHGRAPLRRQRASQPAPVPIRTEGPSDQDATGIARPGQRQQGLVTRIARQLDIGPESLRRWEVEAEIDRGQRAAEEAVRSSRRHRQNDLWHHANTHRRVDTVGMAGGSSLIGLFLLPFLAMPLATCTTPEPAVDGEVSILGAWSDDELAAFQAVVAPFEDRTSVRVEYRATRDLRGILDESLAAGRPPDLAGLEGPAHLRELAARGVLKDLGRVLELGRYRSEVAPTFIDLGTVDGRLVGVFLRSSVKGLIWYDPQVFRLGTPRDWDDLQRMATQAGAEADAEWCVGLESEEASGWPATDLVEQFLVRGSGTADYDAWVEGRLPWTSPQVHDAFELYGQVVADGAVFGGVDVALGTDFREAGDALFREPPGCLFLHQGSFMPVYFPDELEPGTDYDFFAFPRLDGETNRVALGGGDLFGVLSDNAAAAALMRYLVSDEAQTLWVAQGGSLSVKTSVMAYPDTVSQRAASLLTRADVFRFDASDQMPGKLNAAFWSAVLDFTEDQARLDEILAELERIRQGGGSSPT